MSERNLALGLIKELVLSRIVKLERDKTQHAHMRGTLGLLRKHLRTMHETNDSDAQVIDLRDIAHQIGLLEE